jgi:uncharacterized integral membrane protein
MAAVWSWPPVIVVMMMSLPIGISIEMLVRQPKMFHSRLTCATKVRVHASKEEMKLLDV